MSSGFSVADRLHLAVTSCLPCLHRAPSNGSLKNPTSSQLRGLLVDPDSDSAVDSEALSLHSNPGRTRRSRKLKKSSPQRRITLFGYNLFGRPALPPIQLPDDDHDALYPSPGPLESALTGQSTATFDSDAAPLDIDTIDSLSGPTAAALAEAEEEERRQKEERWQRRKERKEIKKLAQALAVSNEGEFEGFQGSGDGYPGIPSPFLPADQEYGSDTQDQRHEQPPSPTSLLPHVAMTQEEDDEEADLDGVVYTRRRVPGNGSNGSDSRSRTSTSISDRYSAVGPPYPHQPPMTTTPRAKKSSSSSSASPKKKRTKSKSTSSHTSSAYARTKSMTSSNSNSNSNYTNTDLTSLTTPTSPQSFFFPRDKNDESHNASIATIISPSTIEQGQGFFDLEDELPQAQVRVMPVMPHSTKSHHQTMGAPGFVADTERNSIFPSTGLGGTRSTGKMRGAFLADTSA